MKNPKKSQEKQKKKTLGCFFFKPSFFPPCPCLKKKRRSRVAITVHFMTTRARYHTFKRFFLVRTGKECSLPFSLDLFYKNIYFKAEQNLLNFEGVESIKPDKTVTFAIRSLMCVFTVLGREKNVFRYSLHWPLFAVQGCMFQIV